LTDVKVRIKAGNLQRYVFDREHISKIPDSSEERLFITGREDEEFRREKP
jgi:hypothetical protein